MTPSNEAASLRGENSPWETNVIIDESRNRIRERLREELEQVCWALTRILGRQSRWSGFADLSDDPNIRGAKPFRCDIVINAILASQAERWRTLIHEMLHTFSEGYQPLDYMAFRGWEEGVVEQLQRTLRPAVLAELGINLDEAVFTAVETDHEYEEYVRALEEMRESLGEESLRFFSRLLAVPIRDRRQSVFEQGMALPTVRRRAFLGAYSSGDAILKTGTRR
jgi:hypothetical protein